VRTALTEAAWAYRFAPAIGAALARRQAGACPETLARSWKATRTSDNSTNQAQEQQKLDRPLHMRFMVLR
jgi:hypothetical protein